MKNIIFIFTVLAIFALNCYSQNSTIDSIYVDFGDKNCKELKNDYQDGILYVGECRGVGGYKLIFYEGDHHQFLDLVAPNGKKIDLDLMETPAPSYLGKVAEWRVRKMGEKIIPIALIVRKNVTVSLDDNAPPESSLLVIKINKDTACLIGKIPPIGMDQNEKARILADASAEKPCLGSDEESAIEMPNRKLPDPEFFKFSDVDDKSELEAEARGDLNGDGLEDWVGVITRKARKIDKDLPDFEAVTAQLYVLLQEKNGSYKLAEKSKEIAIGGNEYVEALEIKTSSVFLQVNSKGADFVEPNHYQFKLYNGEWRLIGHRTLYLIIADDASVETDRNLLTGAVIVKKQKGNRKPTVQRSTQKFQKILLKDFELVQ